MLYHDPKNDLTFKRIFGEHPHLLKRFFNVVMTLTEGKKIVSIEYLPSELVPKIPIEKIHRSFCNRYRKEAVSKVKNLTAESRKGKPQRIAID